MDDVALVDKEDLGSARTRCREVRGEVLMSPKNCRRPGLLLKRCVAKQCRSVCRWTGARRVRCPEARLSTKKYSRHPSSRTRGTMSARFTACGISILA